MGNQDFDRRYPAIFQPGTEAASSTGDDDITAVQDDEPPRQDVTVPVAGETAAAVQPDKRWMVALVTAVLMFGGGLFSLSAQYWATSSRGGPPGYPGTVYAAWGTDVAPAAPALVVAGLGLAAVSLFLVSRRTAEREAAGRKTFGVMAAIVVGAALIALYSFVLFQDQADYSAAAYDGVPRRTPWPAAIQSTGTWTLTLALFMFAVLAIVPRRWAEEITGTQTPGAHPDALEFSSKNALWCGVLAVVGGIAALLVPSIFPAVDGPASQYADAQVIASGYILRPLSLPLLVAGLLVLVWAAIQGTLAHSNSAGRETRTKEAKE